MCPLTQFFTFTLNPTMVILFHITIVLFLCIIYGSGQAMSLRLTFIENLLLILGKEMTINTSSQKHYFHLTRLFNQVNHQHSILYFFPVSFASHITSNLNFSDSIISTSPPKCSTHCRISGVYVVSFSNPSIAFFY